MREQMLKQLLKKKSSHVIPPSNNDMNEEIDAEDAGE